MSARRIEVPPGDVWTDGATAGFPPQREYPSASGGLSGPATEDSGLGSDDPAKFLNELLRRYDEPYPVPWHHGGLNE
jgi:hypothetical protein